MTVIVRQPRSLPSFGYQKMAGGESATKRGSEFPNKNLVVPCDIDPI
jgi:hypothetical protein